MQIGKRALEYEGCLFLQCLQADIYKLLSITTTIDNYFPIHSKYEYIINHVFVINKEPTPLCIFLYTKIISNCQQIVRGKIIYAKFVSSGAINKE